MSFDTAKSITPQYTSWRDLGDNIGIKCSNCGRDHWDDNQPATNPLTKQPCANCQTIKDQNIRATESKIHETEKTGEPCIHRTTQPVQDYGQAKESDQVEQQPEAEQPAQTPNE